VNATPCLRFEETTATDSVEAWAELESHAAGCAECREKLALWKEISAAAPSLRKTWSSPELFDRIRGAIAEGSPAGARRAPADVPDDRRRRASFRWVPAAAVAALVLLSMIGLRVFREGAGREPFTGRPFSRDPLLNEDALQDVERAESAYLASIEKLSLVAAPRLASPDTPLLASYREKLTMLDSAIAETRGEVERNRFNTHLRRELLAMYREKQRTLQDLMKESPS